MEELLIEWFIYSETMTKSEGGKDPKVGNNDKLDEGRRQTSK